MNKYETEKEVIKNLIPQTNENLISDIQHSGCNFRSLSAIAEITSKKCLSYEDILDIYRSVLDQGSIKKDCEVVKPENLVNFVFKFLDSDHSVWNSGYMKDGIAKTWGNEVTENFDYTIIKLYQKDKSKRHFVLGDREGALLWDPYPNSESVKLWNVKDIYLYKVL